MEVSTVVKSMANDEAITDEDSLDIACQNAVATYNDQFILRIIAEDAAGGDPVTSTITVNELFYGGYDPMMRRLRALAAECLWGMVINEADKGWENGR